MRISFIFNTVVNVIILSVFCLILSDKLHNYLIFCSFDHRAFRWMMTMVFAVEEINRNASLLPGVKLGYRIMDSCDHVHTSLQALLSLVSHYKPVMGEVKDVGETQESFDMLNNNGTQTDVEKIVERTKMKKLLTKMKMRSTGIRGAMPHSLDANENGVKENVTEDGMDRSSQTGTGPSCMLNSPVPAVIGLASSSPTRAVAHALGPFNIPLVRQGGEGGSFT